VEVKSGATVGSDMPDGLLWWCRLSGSAAEQAVLVYGGDDAYERSGVAVRPWYSI
jgi:hypothetical protein